MAPIKIQHVVSFSSQDPKHPVDNLLNESLIHPWLSCPRDRSRQLKVDLQLEKASQITYIDIGNSGSAFLQIDVGRSSWPSDKPFVTLLPTTTLMNPMDSKLGKNCNSVRMFKEGDFIAEAAKEKWDRLRIICSQPFNKQAMFGLSFVRLQSPLSEDDQNSHKTASQIEVSQDSSLSNSRLPYSPSRESLANGREDNKLRQEEGKLKDRLHQALSSTSPRIERASPMSRTERMVLSATNSRKRRFLNLTGTGSLPRDPEAADTSHSPATCPDTSRTPPSPKKKEGTKVRRRRLRMQVSSPRSKGRTQVQERRLTKHERDLSPVTCSPPETVQECSCCPICGGFFRVDYLPTHASMCGEVPQPSNIYLSSSEDDSWTDHVDLILPEQTVSWVSCPLCGLRFGSVEIERHASTCGE